jgi:quinol monooxygenase YgiN
MAYTVTAKWTAREGEDERVLDFIRELAPPSREEPGCLVYRVNRDLEDPRVFLLYEEYADEAAYRAHGESDHFRRLALEGAIPLLESRERSFYESLDV